MVCELKMYDKHVYLKSRRLSSNKHTYLLTVCSFCSFKLENPNELEWTRPEQQSCSLLSCSSRELTISWSFLHFPFLSPSFLLAPFLSSFLSLFVYVAMFCSLYWVALAFVALYFSLCSFFHLYALGIRLDAVHVWTREVLLAVAKVPVVVGQWTRAAHYLKRLETLH